MSVGAMWRAARVIAASGAVTLLTGCAVGIEGIPLPSPGFSGRGYTVTAAFSNALNLPTKAKVRLYGADIGEVASIKAEDFTAQVGMHIRADVPLPVGSTAELRSATPLGDVFVQIRPGEGDELLRDGATIPMNLTTAAPTIEELLNSMAMLVNGGAIRAMTTDVNGAGRVVGGRGEKVADLIAETNAFLSRLSARSQQLDATLRSTSDMAAAMAAQRETIDVSLQAAAPALTAIADNTARIADLVDGVARITAQLSRFPSLRGTDTRSVVADVNRLAETFNDIAIDPELSLTSLNRLLGILTKATNSTAGHASFTLRQLALAPLPDMNYPGDIGFHGPDGTDWHFMIGSLRYQWNKLLNQVYGPNRR